MSSSARETQLPPYEITGPAGAPVIAALGGISATRHVCATPDDPASGWWNAIAGPGRALDTTRFRLLGIEYADGGRDAHGRPARAVSTHDQADVLAAALDEAGVARLHALVGASYGGMVALAFAERYPERLDRLVVIGAAHRAHPMSTALRTVQRRIVELGIDSGRPREALALARGLAITSYRSTAEFARRFGGDADAVHRVDAYLRGHGERFAAVFTPERYLALSHSADTHGVDPACITTPTVVVAIEQDAVVPRDQVVELASRLGGPARFTELPSAKGHDGFLTEHGALAPILRFALHAEIAA